MKNKIKFSLLFAISFISFLNAQNNFTVKVNGIKENDSVRIIVQKSSEILFKKWVKHDPSGTATAIFSLDTGKWAMKIDATGYTYPSNTLFTIPDDILATVTLTPLLNTDYTYTWQDDESAAGHATERYINEPAKIVVINDSVKVPLDFSAIKLRTEFGIMLSDDLESWSSEDSYRLYKMFASLPYNRFGEGVKIDYSTGENVRGVFRLTNEEQDDDLKIEIIDGVKYATVSQSAFTYASPQIVTVDGIKGKFFSKRLYHVVVKFITDFARDDNMLAWIAREKFGVEFMVSDQRTEELMGEDASNFQPFFNTEKLEILSMFEELPEGMQKQNGLKYLVRRINGQPNPIYPTAAAIAWADFNTIEFMSVAFSGGEISDSRRLILHEKAHFLWAYTFDQQLKNDWAVLGGWFQDPTNGSGWSTTNTTESVSAYSHALNPNEDMAESIAFYLTNPDALLSVSVRKYEFIRDRVMHGTRYIAQIREDLTFTVYNLFPDYTYPGKVTKLEINVKGAPEEDKEVTIRATLNSINPDRDGAAKATLRFASNVGTIHDIGLYPESGMAQDSVLVGKTTFSKFEKNGYWGLAYFNLYDLVGNPRYENTSTIGMKLYIENPLEDVTPPRFNNDFEMELVAGTFLEGGWQTKPDSNGVEKKALKISFSHYDKNPILRGYAVLTVPNNNMSEVYGLSIQGPAIIDPERGYDNGFNSDKHFEMYLNIQDYYQSGWYATTYSFVEDLANNKGAVYHVNDTTDFHLADNIKIFKTLRDSIYIETPYPDYKKPEIDVNHITINAEPTNPDAPDGETSVKVAILARDLSDYEGHESGINTVSFTFRDPLGGIHGFQTGNGTMVHPDLNSGSAVAQGDNEWRVYNFIIQLPKGSPPGKWGMASAVVDDRAGNREQYSFVEYIRFDIIESDVVLEEQLVATITNKVVNLANADAIAANISCKPCQDKNYVYTIYSLMGGNVVRGSGIFGSDAISLANINTLGVKDGVIKMTVQVTDDQDRLIATTTSEYTKDTVLPKAYYLQTNLEDYGTSNLDELIVKVVVESEDVNGSYKLAFAQNSTTAKVLGSKGITVLASNVVVEGLLDQTEIQLSNIDLSTFKDGIISSTLIITDPNGNEGNPIVTYYNKLDGKLSLIKTITAVNDVIEVNEGGVASLLKNGLTTVLGNDYDSNSGLIAKIVSNPTHGTLALNANGTFSYTHDGSETTGDSFTYVANNGIADSNVATVSISITAVNDAPVAFSDQINVDEGGVTDNLSSGGGNVLTNDTDAENNTLEAILVSNPAHGTLSLYSNGSFVYTHDGSETTTDSFTYKANDGILDSNIVTVYITINLVNDAPVAFSDQINVDEGDVTDNLSSGGGNVLTNDTDAENNTLEAILVSNPAHGTLSLYPNGSFVYTHDGSETTGDSFTYVANNGIADSNVATVSISITAVNDAPVAFSDQINVDEGGVTDNLSSGGGNVLTNDTDAENNTLEAILVSNPAHGTLSLYPNGSFVYTHDGSETTTDSFTYKANDRILDSNIVTVNITINLVNDAPVAIAEAIKVMQGSTITTLVGGENSVLSNDTDAENNSLTAIVVTNPVNGTLTLNANGSFNYHHNGSATTSDSFSYKANDGNTNSNIVTVAITIEPFVLSYNNFSIETKSETCTGMKNGEVIINATQSQNYIAHINGKNYSFVNNSVSIPGMAPGNYPLCITIEGIAFEQCYNITIAGGGSLTGKSSISDNKLNVDITEGTAPFMVFVNGQSQFETIETNFSVSVKQGDLLEVKSAKACEGVYSKTAEDMFEMYSYPNPTNGIFEVAVTTSKQLLYLELFASNGILISKGNYNVENQKVRLSIEDQTAGVYLVKVYTDSPKTITVIKN